MLKVYTSTHSGYHQSDRLDITAARKNIFSPPWDLVKSYKSGKIDQDEYERVYTNEMRKSYRNNKPIWDNYLSRDMIVLVCYCLPGDFCHRVILAKILEKCGAKYIGEIDAE